MKKGIISFVLSAVCITVLIFSCTKNSEDKLVPPGTSTCDTTNVSYSTGITPILVSNCYSCHGNGNTAGSGGILLEGYANLLKWANNGYLVGNVTHAPGYVPMPYGQPELPECEVNTIVAWVNQGAQNN
jgi:mono/diheme cytochrome c family protein